MSTIDARIAELEAQFDAIQKELELLKSQSGGLQSFIKQAESEGTLPGSITPSEVAQLIDLWEKFQTKA